MNTLLDFPDTPLWNRWAMVELIPYGDAELSMNMSGLLLSGRHATQADDLRAIWSFLHPVASRQGTSAYSTTRIQS